MVTNFVVLANLRVFEEAYANLLLDFGRYAEFRNIRGEERTGMPGFVFAHC